MSRFSSEPSSGTPRPEGGRRVGRRFRTRRNMEMHPKAPLPTVEEISAGGMVVREINGWHQVAIIARYNRGGKLEWVLPKGHPEGEEDHREAAVREVAEETGIDGKILTNLGAIDYFFTVPGQRIHKTVHHYLMRATGGTLTIENDPDQEAVDVAWVDIDRLAARLTFLNERRIVAAARELMHDYFDIEPAEPPTQPRRITPRRRALPSGLIPPQLRPEPSSPPTPFDVMKRLGRVAEPEPEPEAPEPAPDPEPAPAPEKPKPPASPKPQPPKPGPHLGRRQA